MAEAERRGRKRKVWKKGVAWKEAKRLEEDRKGEPGWNMRRRTVCGDGSAAEIPHRTPGWATVRLRPITDVATVLLRTIPITPVRGRRFPRRAATGAALPLHVSGLAPVPSHQEEALPSVSPSPRASRGGRAGGYCQRYGERGHPDLRRWAGPTALRNPTGRGRPPTPHQRTLRALANRLREVPGVRPRARSNPPRTPALLQRTPRGSGAPGRGVLGVRPRGRSFPFEAPALLQWAPPGGLASDRAFNAKPAELPGVSAGRPAH